MKHIADMIIGSQPSRRFLYANELVRFFIISSGQPIWMQTPWATYPILPDEDVAIQMPGESGPFRVHFMNGKESITFSYYVS